MIQSSSASYLVEYIIDYNRNRHIDGYPLADDMLDRVRPIPCELWNWAIANRQGHLRQESLDVVRLNTLCAATATVTHKGIKFKDMYYNGDRPRNEGWAERARMNGRWSVDIVWDPRDLSVIYLRPSFKEALGGKSTIAPLERISDEGRRTSIDIGEHKYAEKVKANSSRLAASSKPQETASFDARIAHRVKQAGQKTADAHDGQKKQTADDLRQKRAIATLKERENEPRPLGECRSGKSLLKFLPPNTGVPNEVDDNDFAEARRAVRIAQGREST